MIQYHKFKNEIKNLQQIYGKNPNTLQLFHGTKHEDPSSISTSEIGFDAKYSKMGYYGKGIYFARDAKYSYQDYSYKIQNVNQMFLCDVIVGETVMLGKKEYKHPPEIPQYKEIKKRYDSINDGQGMYIIYENGRAYPTFLISYTIN